MALDECAMSTAFSFEVNVLPAQSAPERGDSPFQIAWRFIAGLWTPDGQLRATAAVANAAAPAHLGLYGGS